MAGTAGPSAPVPASVPVARCAPYPAPVAAAADGEAEGAAAAAPQMKPLKHSLPGRLLAADPERLFDLLFRSFGAGTFQESLRRAIGASLLADGAEGAEGADDDAASPGAASAPAPWAPAPAPGAASASGVGGSASSAEGEAPVAAQRAQHVRRPVQLPLWMRLLKRTPDACDFHEAWTLHGFGPGRGFVVNVTAKVTDTHLKDSFTTIWRYKVVPSADGRSQLDAEMELHWKERSWQEPPVEKAALSEFRRTFEQTFLPLVDRRLLGEAAAAAVAARAWNDEDQPDPEPQQRRGDGGSSQPPLEFALSSAGSTREAESEASWGDASQYELRVEVMSANDLRSPEYRLGDITRSFSSTSHKFGAVYVELALGEKRLKTACAENPQDDHSVGFHDERALFVYKGEVELSVACFDRRKLQAMVRGDPEIGRGSLRLERGLRDCFPRWADVQLMRSSKVAGCVSIRYQLLEVSGPGVVQHPASPTASASVAAAAAAGSAAAGAIGSPARAPAGAPGAVGSPGEDEFETPPGSDSEAV